jgi:hypothetical protein
MSIILVKPIPFHPKINFQKKGGDLNDEGGIDRRHREGGQNLESVS